MPRDLGLLIDEARRAALQPEQPLLLMMAQRKTSRKALSLALSCYSRAAELMEEALAGLPPIKSGTEE